MFLNNFQIEKFKSDGFIKLESALFRDKALNVQDFLWQKLEDFGIFRFDKSTWKQDIVHIKQDFGGNIFDACITEKLMVVIDQLVGNNLKNESLYNSLWGWWPINFSNGKEYSWTVPTEGWHWDGQKLVHSLNSSDFGLLLICIFSDIRPRGGATLLAKGSHKLVINFLKKYHNGLVHSQALDSCTKSYKWLRSLTGINQNLNYRKLTPNNQKEAEKRLQDFFDNESEESGIKLNVVEALGCVGDVYICHPFLYHAASFNHSQSPRFMCNKMISLKYPLSSISNSSTISSPLQEIITETLNKYLEN